MPSFFSPPKPPPLPPPPPPPPTRQDPAIGERRREVAQAKAKRRGRAASVIAGELGKEASLGRPTGRAQTLGTADV